MVNGDDFSLIAALPYWLKLILAILKSQGIATVIALWLVWFVLSSVAGGIKDIQATQLEANKKMGSFVATQGEFDRQRQELLQIQLRINRQTCASVAKNEFDRKGCWE